jgi:hypothetical protein
MVYFESIAYYNKREANLSLLSYFSEVQDIFGKKTKKHKFRVPKFVL